MVAIMEARPETDLPRPAPAGATVAAGTQRYFGGLEKIGRAGRGDLPPRVKAEKVRDVAVLVRGIVAVGFPFLQLPPAADLGLEQPVAHIGDLVAVRPVYAELVRGLDVVGEQVPDDLLVVGHAGLDRALLGRKALRRHQRPVGALDQMVFPELHDFLDERVSDLRR